MVDLDFQERRAITNKTTEVPYNELLTYARKISKYTRPPQSSKYSQTNPADRASIPTDASVALNNTNNGDSVQEESGAATRSLPLGLSEADVTALDPSSQMPFTPWPSEEVMKRGALSRMAYEEELRAQGLLVPELTQHANGNGQTTIVDIQPVRDAPARTETITSQPQRRERPKENPPSLGLSLSLDLYDPDEDGS